MAIKTLLFDFMGTCLDWHTSIVSALPMEIPAATRSAMALHWRQTYFETNAARSANGLPVQDIDITHRDTLLAILAGEEGRLTRVEAGSKAGTGNRVNDLKDTDFTCYAHLFTPPVIDSCLAAWHAQAAWTDVIPTLKALQARGYETIIHANGTTRLQLDLLASSKLSPYFSLAFSSAIMGCYKPKPEAYVKALELLGRKAEEVIMIAAHAEDVAGAREVGIKGLYVYRWSDDVGLDQDLIQKECDGYIVGMNGLVDAVRVLAGVCE